MRFLLSFYFYFETGRKRKLLNDAERMWEKRAQQTYFFYIESTIWTYQKNIIVKNKKLLHILTKKGEEDCQ